MLQQENAALKKEVAALRDRLDVARANEANSNAALLDLKEETEQACCAIDSASIGRI